jgi:hypothetical protein
MPRPGEAIDDKRVALFGQLAVLTRNPDFPLSELTGMYQNDDRLLVPGSVFNAALNRVDAITSDKPQHAAGR